MKTCKIALLILLPIIIFGVCSAADAYMGKRFGPALYFGPYYFPKHLCDVGICFTPDDFKPRYQDPNPLPPGPIMAMPPKPPVRKVKPVQKCAPVPACAPQGACPPGVAAHALRAHAGPPPAHYGYSAHPNPRMTGGFPPVGPPPMMPMRVRH